MLYTCTVVVSHYTTWSPRSFSLPEGPVEHGGGRDDAYGRGGHPAPEHHLLRHHAALHIFVTLQIEDLQSGAVWIISCVVQVQVHAMCVCHQVSTRQRHRQTSVEIGIMRLHGNRYTVRYRIIVHSRGDRPAHTFLIINIITFVSIHIIQYKYNYGRVSVSKTLGKWVGRLLTSQGCNAPKGVHDDGLGQGGLAEHHLPRGRTHDDQVRRGVSFVRVSNGDVLVRMERAAVKGDTTLRQI